MLQGGGLRTLDLVIPSALDDAVLGGVGAGENGGKPGDGIRRVRLRGEGDIACAT